MSIDDDVTERKSFRKSLLPELYQTIKPKQKKESIESRLLKSKKNTLARVANIYHVRKMIVNDLNAYN